MAKGDISFVKCLNSIGNPVGLYDDNNKRVGTVDGSYKHTQTINGISMSWKCGALRLTGVIKLVEDEYMGNVFYRMEGMVDDMAQMDKINTISKSIEEKLAANEIVF